MPGQTKTRRKPVKPGPFSRDKTLSRLDRRTKAGKLMRTIAGDLVNDLGGDPSAAERLLIQAASVKAVRLSLLADMLLEGGDIGEGSDHHAIAWFNSMRLDLMAIGLARRSKDITPSPLAEHFKRAPAPAEAQR